VNATGTITLNVTAFICGTNSVLDIDNNTYNTVLIGAQCWTKENLRVTKYNDGTNIPEITSTGTWNTTIVTGARTVYNDLPANLTTYGYLYNWYAATDSRKLCPAGWHVPTDAEWTTLETYLNNVVPTGSVGGKMKSTSSLWNPNTGAVNTSGFSALPGGIRQRNGSFNVIRTDTFFWSATGFGINEAWNRSLASSDSNLYRDNWQNGDDKSSGLSVRCLRD
jgi:uncharacterized protein (TIGR02145 family)